jgi:hypothetical protein
MRRIVSAVMGVMLVATGAAGQELKRPETWKVRLDRGHGGPIPDSLYYVSMPPGWHVTTRRHSAIFYDPAWKASGDYRITTTIFLFADSRQEGYGLFLDGRDLEGEGQAYLYLLLRRDGKYLVKHRQGAETHDIVAWTEHASIARPTETDDAKNVMVVEARGDTITFRINGQEVASWPRGEVDARGEGQVGLRVNHGVNLHVTEVKIEPIS